MLILADENCDTVLVARLRGTGHDVFHILEKRPGAPDEAVLTLAADHDRILLTNDLEFGILAERFDTYPPAIVLLRLDPLRAHLVGKFFVVEPGSIRERVMERRER